MKNMKNNRYIEQGKKKEFEKEMIRKANMHINLGLVVYFLIFSYLVFCVLNFSFSEKTNYTMAEPGSIVESEIFTGIILKNETLVNSSIEGTPNYFVPEGKKVKKGSLVGYVDSTGEVALMIQEKLNEEKEKQLSQVNISVTDDKYIQSKLKNYALNKNSRSFQYTYNAKADIEKSILDTSNTILLEDSQILNNILSSSQKNNLYYAPKSGVVSYKFDGYEDIKIDTFLPSQYDEAIMANSDLTVTPAQTGHLFKIVDNYKWYLAAEINDICEKYLENKDYATILIDYNDLKLQGRIYDVINEEEKTYLILEFDRYLDEFLDERFMQFTVVYSNSEGIKIPTTAITNKEFLKVPIEALIKSNQRMEVRKKVLDEKLVGGQSLEGIPINIYKVDDRFVYIPKSDKLSLGDTIVYVLDNGKNESFVIEESVTFQGVFVLNKGYAAFKFIEVLSYTDDYKVIKETTEYGVNPYDRIATNANKLVENQIIN